MATTCSRCSVKQPLLGSFHFDQETKAYYCPACNEKLKSEKAANLERLTKLAQSVIVTTTPGIDGQRVLRYLGIESVEFVIGTGLFSEITTEWQDFFGQRSSAFETKLQQAKTTAIQTMRMRAAAKGANAVVAVDLDYTEFSGNRIGLMLNGTLVEVGS